MSQTEKVFPYDARADGPDDAHEPRPERDPDEVRQQRADDAWQMPEGPDDVE